jgi:hypothetical protein
MELQLLSIKLSMEKRQNYGVDQPMINFKEGKINLGAKNILVVSDSDDLNALAEEGLIAKREDGSGAFYYVESVAEGMRFGVFIRFRDKRIHRLVLHWLDGPCTGKGWDDVSEKALKDEYRILLNFVEKTAGTPADNKGNRQCTWRFEWGRVDVSYEPRDFVAAIFMKPR